MNREELLKLRAKLFKLSDKERIKRDRDLQKYYIGELQGPLTGHPEIDRPFVKNYRQEPIANIDVYKTMFENFEIVASKNPQKIFIYNNDGKTKTYGQILKQAKRTASGLHKLGFKKGDRIGVMSMNSIDEPGILMASNKLGIEVKYIDYWKEIDGIIKSVEKEKVDLLIIDEVFLPNIEKINKKKVPVIISETNKMYKKNSQYTLPYIEALGNDKQSPTIKNEPLIPAVSVTSSGTTGTPKPIVHSNYSVNCAVRKLCYTDFYLGENTLMLKPVPSHIGMGLIGTLYMSLITNTSIYMIKGFSPLEAAENVTNFCKNFNSFRIKNNLPKETKVTLFAAPMFYKMMAERIDEFQDLSFMGTILSAGSKIIGEEIERIYKIFSKKGCTNKIINVYGQNEMNLTSHNSEHANYMNTVGYPTIGTNIIVVDNDNNVLDPENEGRILEQSDAQFLEYANMEEKTKNAFIKLKDGSIWFDTQDIGIIHKNGSITISGRESRSMIKQNCKISIDEVEAKIKNHPGVKECAMIALDQPNDENDLAVLYLVTTNENLTFEKIKQYLASIQKPLGIFETPEHVEILHEFPYSASGKPDLQLLKANARKKYLHK